mmetsp:Transcript_42477/g.128905  ORF Transcript_42477/g.128905 Transcript_42477/m.128905 type:complete len:85 (-) Transcript_42477:1243-1497(-)
MEVEDLRSKLDYRESTISSLERSLLSQARCIRRVSKRKVCEKGPQKDVVTDIRGAVNLGRILIEEGGNIWGACCAVCRCDHKIN